MDDHIYNLTNQLTQEAKALWRIRKHYLSDAEGCEDCRAFWEKLANDKEEHIAELQELISAHAE